MRPGINLVKVNRAAGALHSESKSRQFTLRSSNIRGSVTKAGVTICIVPAKSTIPNAKSTLPKTNTSNQIANTPYQTPKYTKSQIHHTKNQIRQIKYQIHNPKYKTGQIHPKTLSRSGSHIRDSSMENVYIGH